MGMPRYFTEKWLIFFISIFRTSDFFGKTFYTWPIFNFADIWVSVGFVLIIVGYKWIFKKEASFEGGSQLNAVISENSSDLIPDNNLKSHGSENGKTDNP